MLAAGGGVMLLTFAAGACGFGRSAPPGAGESRGGIPDLAGMEVMVFPVQSSSGVRGDATAELVFALGDRAPDVAWVFPDELRAVAARSPALDVEVDRLPVGIFMRAEVRRVGDPLFGNLFRLASVTNARAALIPVAARYRDPDAGDPADSSNVTSGTVEVTAALTDVGSGRVLWFGVVAGQAADRSDPVALASAMDALARRFGRPRGF